MRVAHLSELVYIKNAAGTDADFSAIKHDIQTSRAILIEHAQCFCVLRLDFDGLVVVCAEGRNLSKIAPHIVTIAKKAGAPSIIFHTRKRGLKRLLKPLSFNYLTTDSNGLFVFKLRFKYGE